MFNGEHLNALTLRLKMSETSQSHYIDTALYWNPRQLNTKMKDSLQRREKYTIAFDNKWQNYVYKILDNQSF